MPKPYWIARAEREAVIKEYCPNITNHSGIYILARQNGDEKVAYVGQSVHVLTRLAEHLGGFQWIDKSLKKWGLYSESNLKGYCIRVCYCPKAELDEKERAYIALMQAKGYELRNLTSGGQDDGKEKIGEWKAPKGYQDGLKQGYRNAQKEVSHWFDKSLDYAIKGTTNANKQKAYDRFTEFIKNEENT